ncbi:peptidoglycan DD-metalloendopeptidase family protein [Brevundimonas sp.]|uniref:peptidoglycan DD-metalloendopeptidase family protein n=1 Tax=Brevundimonas sp. TaxID=1871086 RepID=UPI003562EEE6
MTGLKTGLRVLIVAGGMLALAACTTAGPRYSIYADAAPPPSRAPYPTSPAYPTYPTAPAPSGEGVRGPSNPYNDPAPNATAPVATIEGGALDAPVYVPRPGQPAAGPADGGFTSPPPPRSGTTVAGARYVIQPGDTISGIGRRFQTPVQSLIDLNSLGPRAAITPGQRLTLPESAVDIGGDPYATGPSPSGVYVPNPGSVPPPPPPPSGNVALPPVSTTADVSLDWPVRGDILRRFGPVGMGERNNGINIGASAGREVGASAAGQVAYVGDDLAGQGLTILVAHPGGWRTAYGHLGSATVRQGDQVRAGQQIGTVGTTAGDGRPSIHFETWRMRGDEPIAIDPLTVLPR